MGRGLVGRGLCEGGWWVGSRLNECWKLCFYDGDPTKYSNLHLLLI